MSLGESAFQRILILTRWQEAHLPKHPRLGALLKQLSGLGPNEKGPFLEAEARENAITPCPMLRVMAE